jgi:carboxylesterase type B
MKNNNVSAELCPVMLWIHGGAWIIGDDIGRGGGYNGSALALQHGVVVVAINYRLDAFGWLALKEFASEAPDGSFGNFGLKDQRLAMQWARRNIHAFGGDPMRVAIFGQSAGAFSVCQHLVSPGSDRLFSRAIVQSGGCNGPWLIQEGSAYAEFGSAYASAVGCGPAVDPAFRLACLRSKRTEEVLLPWLDFICTRKTKPTDPWCGSRNQTTPWLGGERGGEREGDGSLVHLARRAPPFGIFGLTAVVDGAASGLPATPLTLLRQGRVNRASSGAPLQVMMGSVLDEMALFIVGCPLLFAGTHLPPARSDVLTVAKRLASYHSGWNASTADAIARQYDGTAVRSPDDGGSADRSGGGDSASDGSSSAAAIARPRGETSAYKLTRLGTDVIFRCAVRDAARALAAANVSTFVYVFEYRTAHWHDPTSLRCDVTAEVGCGVHHAADIPFTFGERIPAGSASQSVSAGIQSYWANMAAGGDPNGVRVRVGEPAGAVPTAWPAYEEASDRYLVIAPDGAFSSAQGLSKRECDFWASLPPNPW